MVNIHSKIKVGILRGGIGHEYDVSLKTGGSVLKYLPSKYKGYDILITKDGDWHIDGVKINPIDLNKRVDILFNALHGRYGEDGKVQQELNTIGIPYTGSSSFSSAISMNKVLSKKYFEDIDIKIPMSRIISVDINNIDSIKKELFSIFRVFPQPSIVKPVSGGSSVGVYKIKSYDDLLGAVLKVAKFSNLVLIEEYIDGREVTCGVVDGFRGEKYYALPPTEILVPPKHDFFNFESKYSGDTKEICPGNFSKKEKELLLNATISAHSILGLRHYSRSDFILSKRGVYILETNTLPGLTEESLFPKSLEAVGSSMPEFLDHVIMLAIGGK
jgi:D-alanine-D-alanine ligase